MDVCHICAPWTVKFMIIVSQICIVFVFNMDLSQQNEKDDIEKLSRKIPVLSEYATSLESHVKLRYLQKISVVGIDPINIPCGQFHPECLPPIEQFDLFGYLVLQTSYYTSDQFKNYKSLEESVAEV